jgi:hypothetical protein
VTYKVSTSESLGPILLRKYRGATVSSKTVEGAEEAPLPVAGQSNKAPGTQIGMPVDISKIATEREKYAGLSNQSPRRLWSLFMQHFLAAVVRDDDQLLPLMASVFLTGPARIHHTSVCQKSETVEIVLARLEQRFLPHATTRALNAQRFIF